MTLVIKTIMNGRLSAVLKAWDMCLSNVQGDGNCCFSAVAFGLSANWGSFTDEEKTALILRGLLASMNEETMAAKLRKLAVEEWLANSSSFFQPMLRRKQWNFCFLDTLW